MGYWKTKVLPKIQKVFGKDAAAKKAEAAEACKSFDDSKDEVSKEFEEKKAELQPKVLEIYEASSVEIKTLVKDPKVSGLKKHSAKVQTFLDDLVKIEFPGSKSVSEVSSKYGPGLVSAPITFIFEKVSTFIVVEEKPREIEAAPPSATTEPETTVVVTTTEATTEATDREIVVEEDKLKEETVVEAPTTTPSKEDPPKVEETPVEEPPKA